MIALRVSAPPLDCTLYELRTGTTSTTLMIELRRYGSDQIERNEGRLVLTTDAHALALAEPLFAQPDQHGDAFLLLRYFPLKTTQRHLAVLAASGDGCHGLGVPLETAWRTLYDCRDFLARALQCCKFLYEFKVYRLTGSSHAASLSYYEIPSYMQQHDTTGQ